MPSFWDNIPITHAIGPDGELCYIDSVPNGKACGCTCPDPLCGQPLTARQGDIRIHHFAHTSGSQECRWAIEHVLSTLAAEIVSQNGAMVFPDLEYHDYQTGNRHALLAKSGLVRISSVELAQVSGRRSPDLVLTCNAGKGNERKYLAVVCLTHPVDKYRDQIIASGFDAFVVDFRQVLTSIKKADKHFDRERVFARFQSKAYLESVLANGDGKNLSWIVNSKAEKESHHSYELHLQWLEEEKKRRAAEAKAKAEREAAEAKLRAEREAAEEEMRKRLRAQLENEARILREQEAKLEEERQAEERCREKETAEKRKQMQIASKESVLQQIDQQEKQAIDAFGRRWIRCEICGEVKTKEQFPIYGGPGRINLGKCYSCMYPGR